MKRSILFLLFVGVSSVARAQTVSLVEPEYIVLTERDGRLAYEAHPSGQPPATFLSMPVSGREVVFEDPAHDFPQRVGYKRTRPGQLLAWIEGTSGGKARRVEFNYRIVSCVGV